MEEAHPGVAFIGVEGLRGGEGFVGVAAAVKGLGARVREKRGKEVGIVAEVDASLAHRRGEGGGG